MANNVMLKVYNQGEVLDVHLKHIRQVRGGGRIYQDLDTGEISPEIKNGDELIAWYLNRPIVQALL